MMKIYSVIGGLILLILLLASIAESQGVQPSVGLHRVGTLDGNNIFRPAAVFSYDDSRKSCLIVTDGVKSPSVSCVRM